MLLFNITSIILLREELNIAVRLEQGKNVLQLVF